jgi:hypothetical protein
MSLHNNHFVFWDSSDARKEIERAAAAAVFEELAQLLIVKMLTDELRQVEHLVIDLLRSHTLQIVLENHTVQGIGSPLLYNPTCVDEDERGLQADKANSGIHSTPTHRHTPFRCRTTHLPTMFGILSIS